MIAKTKRKNLHLQGFEISNLKIYYVNINMQPQELINKEIIKKVACLCQSQKGSKEDINIF